MLVQPREGAWCTSNQAECASWPADLTHMREGCVISVADFLSCRFNRSRDGCWLTGKTLCAVLRCLLCHLDCTSYCKTAHCTASIAVQSCPATSCEYVVTFTKPPQTRTRLRDFFLTATDACSCSCCLAMCCVLKLAGVLRPPWTDTHRPLWQGNTPATTRVCRLCSVLSAVLPV